MTQEPPIAIAVTWGKGMILDQGGLLPFIRHFEKTLGSDKAYWLQKCRNKPKHDVLYVYLVVCNQVRYKALFGGYATGEVEVTRADDTDAIVSWPRIILAGPIEKAPRKIAMRGFQGFRYVKEFF